MNDNYEFKERQGCCTCSIPGTMAAPEMTGILGATYPFDVEREPRRLTMDEETKSELLLQLVDVNPCL